MPRGRKSAVRYYFDSVTGSVIAVAKEGSGYSRRSCLAPRR